MKTTITRFALIVIITCWLSSCKKNDQEVTSSDAHLELLVDKSFSVDFTKEVRRRDGLNALKILSARENSLFIRGQLKDLADSFYKLEDLPHFKEASTQLLNESKVAGDSLHIEKAFKNYMQERRAVITTHPSVHSIRFQPKFCDLQQWDEFRPVSLMMLLRQHLATGRV